MSTNPITRLHDAVVLAATHVWLSLAAADPSDADRAEGVDRGQATTEYALVLLAAASIALVLVAWATKGGKLTRLFDAVVDQLIGKAK
ncbi:MAG TPA: DUF4244 domain-containing protein [Acidimicrobiales bacterium]|jgi:hypothetical protein|nr:DUF4244 domain-containing protein [Acidimicrobiales bacterium]